MKQGKFAIIITCVLYGFAIIGIVFGLIGTSSPFVGEESLTIFREISVADKIDYYISQSARNALYLTNKELATEGLFDKKTCIYEQEKVVLFSQGSCTLTKNQLEQHYLETFMTHFTPLLEKEIYTVHIKEFVNSKQLSLTLGEKTVQVTGKVPTYQLDYTGKEVTYGINPSFTEEVQYALQDYLTILEAVATNLDCITRQKTSMALACSLPAAITWESTEKGDYLFITTTTKNNISFSFAINLKTIQKLDTSLFT